MKIGDKVKMITYQGTLKKVYDIEPGEDYWQLIGSKGRIIDDSDLENEGTVFVRFNHALHDYKFNAHNEERGMMFRNSLSILESDLELDTSH